MTVVAHHETTAERLAREHRERSARLSPPARRSMPTPPPQPALPAQIVAAATAMSEITMADAAVVLPPLHPATALADLVRIVTVYFKLLPRELVGPSRIKPVARPRQIVCYLGRGLLHKSYPSIGRALGGRDHTTVIAAERRVTLELTSDAKLAADVAALGEYVAAQIAAWNEISTREETTSMQCDQRKEDGNGTDSATR